MKAVIPLLLLCSTCAADEIPLVWSEVDVDRTPAEYRGDMQYPDICVGLPEVTNRQENKQYRLTAPGRLKRRDKNGTVTTLYDCKASGQICVPTDPRISFDGKKVAFTIYRGSVLEPQCNSKNRGLAGKVGANIGVVDLTTGQVTEWPYVPGRFDLTPTFINQGGAVKIMFSSDRDREYQARTSTRGYVNERYPNLQTFIADIDGSNTVKTGYHDMAAFYGGWQMKDGRVMGSCAQRNHDLTFRDGGASINFPGTHTNDWWVCGQDPWGGSQESLFGAHYRLVAQHYFTQLSDGRVCTDDYYRGNYNLTGRLLCWTPQPFTVEGIPTKEATKKDLEALSPRDLFDPAPWSNASDTKSTWNEEQNRWEGRLRDPFGLPDGDLGVVWCDGICNQRAGAPAAEYNQMINLGPEKTIAGIKRPRTQIAHPVGAQYGIYYLPKATLPSKTSLDLVKLIDDPNVNEFGAIYGGPYVDVYGQAMPDTMARPASPDDKCYLHIASQQSDTTSWKVLNGQYQWGYLEHTGTHGKELVGVTDADVKFIRISKVLPNKEVQAQYVGTDPKSQWFSSWGFKNETLGDAPVEADGSVKAQIPCETPFLLQGLNARHEVVKRDMVVQSLRPASVLTCTGCHDHNDLPNKPAFENTIAATKPATVLDGSANTRQPELNADIYPIIHRNCGACHDDSQKPNLRDHLYETLLLDYKQETNPHPVLVRPDTPQHAGGKRTWLDRPHLSWLINGSHAAGSALYWYLTDARRDYLTNASYPNDLDFNAAHPKVNASAADIALVRDWIDRGALHDPKVKPPAYSAHAKTESPAKTSPAEAPVEPPRAEPAVVAEPAAKLPPRRVERGRRGSASCTVAPQNPVIMPGAGVSRVPRDISREHPAAARTRSLATTFFARALVRPRNATNTSVTPRRRD